MKTIISISTLALFAGAAMAEDINYNVTAETGETGSVYVGGTLLVDESEAFGAVNIDISGGKISAAEGTYWKDGIFAGASEFGNENTSFSADRVVITMSGGDINNIVAGSFATEKGNTSIGSVDIAVSSGLVRNSVVGGSILTYNTATNMGWAVSHVGSTNIIINGDAVIGGRRPKGIPLVFESFNWTHGVYLGAMMGSERTAAAEGKAGELRSDPMAMLPFAGYNMADYLGHLVKMGKNLKQTPRFYHVNWFRRDADGNFMWPGFGANARVLAWIVNRQNGCAKARETAIGFVPTYEDIDWDGLEYSKETFEELMTYDPATVSAQPLSEELYEMLPHSLKVEREALLERLS